LPILNEKLLAIARAVEFRRGARLLRQGEPARGAFVLAEGSAQARVALPGGGTLEVAELAAGDMLGETALIERGTCMASVVARSDIRGWFIARDDFRALVAARDAAALEIHKAVTEVLSKKLRTAAARLREYRAAEDRAAIAAHDEAGSSPAFDWRAFLPMLAFFDGFAPAEIEELVDGCPVLELPRGAALFRADAPAEAAYLVLRGAAEVVIPSGGVERRVTIAGPGELLGYLAVLERRPHVAEARIREGACVMALSAAHLLRHYDGNTAVTVRLQRAIHRSLLQALARTNAQLIRLISHARLGAARADAEDLERALHGQIVLSNN
jgi:CRP-like cAMP-binding protein